MSEWDSSSGAVGSGSFNAQQVMAQVKNEFALANVQELMSKMNDQCFKKCIPKPGSKLDSSDQACLAKCMDRYMEAWNIVAKVYANRLQKEQS